MTFEGRAVRALACEDLVLGCRFVNRAAANDRFQYVHVRDVFGWDFQRVAIKDDGDFRGTPDPTRSL